MLTSTGTILSQTPDSRLDMALAALDAINRVQAVVEFHSADGVSVVQFETRPLLRFLRRTYTAIPVGTGETPVTSRESAAHLQQ